MTDFSKHDIQVLKDFLIWARDNKIEEVEIDGVKVKFYKSLGIPKEALQFQIPKTPEQIAEEKQRKLEKDLFGV